MTLSTARPTPRRPWWRRWLRRLGWTLGLVLLWSAAVSLRGLWLMRGLALPTTPSGPVVEEVTRLYSVPVARVVTPTTVEEVAEAVRTAPGAISVGGGRYSMGGQTATPDGTQIDMRRMNRVLAVDTIAETVHVQAGARWRDVQAALDSLDRSVQIMQTYANFTVGGSLSVNVHGRYVGLGPLVLSVRRLRLVLPDGRIAEATPDSNATLFHGAIGGYGGLGVITDAVLGLARNRKVERTNRVMPLVEYARVFRDSIRQDTTAIFHNADIYPGSYTTVNAVTYRLTDRR